jgi:threonine dehydratase
VGVVTRKDIEAAAARINGRVRCTPVIQLEEAAFGIGAEIFLKLELFQHTGSFKPRGAFNRILSVDVPPAGVITASGGNHGQAVAYASKVLGIDAEIFVPEGSPPLKAERIRRHGAVVTVTGEYFDDAMDACRERALETGALLVHAYDDQDVVAGQGLVGREMEGQLPDVDTVLVAVGGGGLAAGVAAWYQSERQVVTVEPESCTSLASALAAGQPVDVNVGGIASDALGARKVGEIPFSIAREHVSEAVLVSDEAILDARQRLWDSLRIVAEPGGVASLAALLSAAYVPAKGERVGVIICGGNTASLPDAST